MPWDRELSQTSSLPVVNSVLDAVFRLPTLKRKGLWLEFGAAGGATLSKLAENRGDARVYGFDSFAGLPEDWIRGDDVDGKPMFPKGHFAVSEPPDVPGAELVIGLFADTLPSFSFADGPVTLMHVDCDLYSGAKCALDHCRPHLESGSIVVFDELLLYPGHEEHELRALREAYEDGMRWEWLCRGGVDNEAAAIVVRE